MKIVFRADASSNIGAGHVMRCAAIAEAAKARGIVTELNGCISNLFWLNKEIENGLFDIYTNNKSTKYVSNDYLIIDKYELDINDKVIYESKWLKSELSLIRKRLMISGQRHTTAPCRYICSLF